MQDKRVRAGVTDVYVHDEAGNPVLRLPDATNGSLTTWLSAVAKLLRNMVGPKARIVLGFDRGGAFPEQLAALRDEGFELVTYERKPYPLLAPSAFDITFTHSGERLDSARADAVAPNSMVRIGWRGPLGGRSLAPVSGRKKSPRRQRRPS